MSYWVGYLHVAVCERTLDFNDPIKPSRVRIYLHIKKYYIHLCIHRICWW